MSGLGFVSAAGSSSAVATDVVVMDAVSLASTEGDSTMTWKGYADVMVLSISLTPVNESAERERFKPRVGLGFRP